MRVARGLEQPADKPEVFTDASGKATAGAGARQHRRDRQVHQQRRHEGDAVWGTRGKMDDARRHRRRRAGHARDSRQSVESRLPHHWHARGYGLFAANPLGDKRFQRTAKSAEPTRSSPASRSTFRYRDADSQRRRRPRTRSSASQGIRAEPAPVDQVAIADDARARARREARSPRARRAGRRPAGHAARHAPQHRLAHRRPRATGSTRAAKRERRGCW